MSTLWVRAGDGDNYNSHDDVDSAAAYLYEMGAVPTLERCNEYGLSGPGFEGHNYVSIYYGDDADAGEPAERGLTDEEIDELNEALERFVGNEEEIEEEEEEEGDDEEELRQEAIENCYYGDKDHCHGELWECQTCGETYCEGHWHETDKGKNVECVACERERLEAAKA